MSDEDDAYRAKLAAQTTRWRLAIGVASWSVAAIGLGFVALTLGASPLVHVDGVGRLLGYALPAIATFFTLGWVTLRMGEIDLTTGRFVRAEPVPWSRIVPLVIAVFLVLSAIAAWPLGVYTSLRAASTSCGALVPIARLQAHTTLPLAYATVSTEDDGCDVQIVARGRADAAVVIRERPAPDDHEWRSLLSRFHPDRREPLALDADAALLLENDDVFVIATRRGRVASFVQLRREIFDRDAVLALSAALGR